LLGKQPTRRHAREIRVAVVGVTVVVGELDRLRDGMDVLGRAETHLGEIEALEDVQGLKEHGPLVPEAALVDRVPMEAGRGWFLALAMVSGQVLIGEETAGPPGRVGHTARDLSFVERVTPGAKGARAVVAALELGALGGDDRPERDRELGLAKRLAGDRQ